jgi:hypothetical protein
MQMHFQLFQVGFTGCRIGFVEQFPKLFPRKFCLIQSTKRRNVQRGSKTGFSSSCGGFSAFSKLFLISDVQSSVILEKKGAVFHLFVYKSGSHARVHCICEPIPSPRLSHKKLA